MGTSCISYVMSKIEFRYGCSDGESIRGDSHNDQADRFPTIHQWQLKQIDGNHVRTRLDTGDVGDRFL